MAGWFDGFWEIGLSKWDIAAGALLVKEAGGIVSDFNEKQAWMKTGNIVAANAKIYGDFIKIIQKNEWRVKKSVMALPTSPFACLCSISF